MVSVSSCRGGAKKLTLTSADRKTRRFWLAGLALAVGVFIGMFGGLSDLPTWIFAAAIVPYVAAAFLGFQALGVRAEWRLQMTNGEDRLLEIHLYPSALPPFSEYTVLLNGSEVLSQRGSSGLTDHLELQLGESGRGAVVTVRGRNLWPLRPTRLMVDVEGARLAEL